MKRKLALALMLVLMLVMLVPFEALAQEIVVTLASADTFTYPNQRKTFYTNELYWVVYGVSTTLYYKTSADGASWSTATTLRTSTYTLIGNYAIYFDGTYVHMVVKNSTSDYGNYYRRGIPNSDGTITWSTLTWQSTGLDHHSCLSVTVDSNGYPWVMESQSATVSKSSTNDGTWVTAVGFPVAMSGTGGVILPLTSGKMVAVYNISGSVKATRWTGSAWGSEASGTSNLESWSLFSAVAQDDDVHVVFLKKTTYDIIYTKYSYSTNTFSAETTLYSAATSTSAPVITMDNANNLHVFWENDPTDDHVYYAKYIYDTSTWVSYYDLITEIDLLPATGYYLNTDYTCDVSRVGVYYIADSTILKFKLLDEVFHVHTKDADPIGDTTATLQGEIISLGFGSATERGFWINDTPDLSGATLEGNETPGPYNVGVFTHGITGLTEGLKYYYCAYASNDYGLEYGTWSQFTAGGSAGGIAVLTLDPSGVGDFEATFNGEIVATGGDYLTMRGFQWGFSDTPTWMWDEGGSFTVGLFSYTPTDLEADSIYYVRAMAGNGTDTDYGQWIGFITEQPSYVPGEDEIGNDTGLIPPLPEEPGGWIRPPKDWGMIYGVVPWTFIMFLVSLFLLVAVGLVCTKYTRSLAVTFMVLGFFLGVLCFWPKGGYLDWWVLFPYTLVGWALLQRQSESPIAE